MPSNNTGGSRAKNKDGKLIDSVSLRGLILSDKTLLGTAGFDIVSMDPSSYYRVQYVRFQEERLWNEFQRGLLLSS
jgi:hypothetical protein